MTEPNRDPDLDDVLVPEEQAHPDHREHAKTPHRLDDEELERRAQQERDQLNARGPLTDD
ncbi:hypothetical protein [Pseudonocardia pini]|uniref:hypothetical protein n=1 Tax=Pseudonocardia pini TaxID=2758030 RepID=UPI0015F07F31|nr:hypothetical protein [Pseudonocardia pini]